MELADLEKYLDMARRRQWWIILPTLITLLAGFTFWLISPQIYEAKTLILIVPQKVPENYVRSIVSLSMEERLRTIKQQVTSRTNLEKIINKFNLFKTEQEKYVPVEEKVIKMQEKIKISVAQGTAFTLSFRNKDPFIAKEVTNTLASNFITENLKIRESMALGTLNFLAEELESVKSQLEAKEQLIKDYQQKHMGALPEQLQTNLSILGRLQNQLEQLTNNLNAAESRKLIIQQQIAELESAHRKTVKTNTDNAVGETGMNMDFSESNIRNLASLREQLALLKRTYTENHPDVIRMKKIIEKMELEIKDENLEPEKDSISINTEPTDIFSSDFLKPQLRQLNGEIKILKAEIAKVESRIEIYQKRVEDTPKREQELLSLNRDYGNLKDLYDSLLTRKLEADIALNLEKKQKGEQFRVLDPAKTPENPVGPKILKTILISLFLGLGLGGGLAFLFETSDTSFKIPQEIKNELQLPVLVSLPIQITEKESKNIRRRNMLAYVGTAVGFILSTIGIILATKGVDNTFDFIRKLVSGA